MVKTFDKNAQRMKRHTRVRGKISGTPERPRLNVYRSNANIYAQIIDDVNGVTLASASTLDKDFEGATGNKEAARKVGKMVAERAKAKGIDTVVRSWRLYLSRSCGRACRRRPRRRPGILIGGGNSNGLQ